MVELFELQDRAVSRLIYQIAHIRVPPQAQVEREPPGHLPIVLDVEGKLVQPLIVIAYAVRRRCG
jgi:hypothetical protein